MPTLLNRRALLGTAAGALLEAQSPQLQIIPTPQGFAGWPTLVRRKNGELIAAYSGSRESHVCPFGRVELVRSRDNGQSWSAPQVVLDTPVDDRDAGILETARGTLLVSTFTSLAYEKPLREAKDWPAEKLARWQAAQRATTPEQRQALLGTWMLRSTDGGLTWSAPYRVPLNSPHGPIATASGALLYPGKKLYSPQGEIGMAISKDDGVTWRWLSTIPTRPGDQVENYHELHGVETAPGRVLVHIRNHNPANAQETLQTESRDGGRTWSTPHAIGVWGLPSHLLKLRDGRLVMSYGYRRAPIGNHIRTSRDQGATWSEPVVVSNDGIGDIGYPSTVELEGGELLTLWYQVMQRGTGAVLRTARYRV